MVEFREINFGERQMVAVIEDVHRDEVGRECPITRREPKSSQIHFVLAPVSPAGWAKQNWWLYDTLATGSSWHEVIRQFKKLGILTESEINDAKSNEELAKIILNKCKGKNIKFAERRLGRALKPNWFPEAIV